MKIISNFNHCLKLAVSPLLLLILFLLPACNGPSSDAPIGTVLGRDQVNDASKPLPNEAPPDTSNGNPNSGENSSTRLGDSCHTSDPAHLCLSLKYVVYENLQAKAIVSGQEALQNLALINKTWLQCNIGFEIGEYLSVDPQKYGLSFNTSSMSELSQIRSEFDDNSTLLVVTTGAWSGSLGAGAANAWTTMPGGGTYGAILEEPVGNYPNIIAHELGHYLNLSHVSDTSDVMNPVIYQGSTQLTTNQCEMARSAASYYWKTMLR